MVHHTNNLEWHTLLRYLDSYPATQLESRDPHPDHGFMPATPPQSQGEDKNEHAECHLLMCSVRTASALEVLENDVKLPVRGCEVEGSGAYHANHGRGGEGNEP
jgi:hypothetical protein